MLKRWIVVLAVMLPIISCTSHLRHGHVHRSKPQAAEPYHMAEFTRVVAKGHLSLRLHTGARRPWILLHGDPRDTAKVTWTVSHRTIYLDLAKGYPKYGPVEAEIGSRYLVAIDYHGRGSITGQRLHSKLLDVTIVNSGKTLLEGQMNLHQLVLGGTGTVHLNGGRSRSVHIQLRDNVHAQMLGISNVDSISMSGYSRLSMYWLKSKTFRLFMSDHARAQIAGTTNVALVELRGHAHFNGRYLRATEAFVKTYGKSEADIAVVKTQHTLASDHSDIFYYEAPVYETDFMADNGAVLDLKAWDVY